MAFQASSAQFDPAAETELLTLTNRARAENGLPPLTLDPRLTQAARRHSQLMAQHSLVSHQLDDEAPLQNRIAEENVRADEVSENIAFSNRGVIDAQEGLMHSPPHRRAILSTQYDAIGIGVLRAGDAIYVTEDFARRLPEYSEPQAEAAVQAAIAQYAKTNRIHAPALKQQPELRRMACSMSQRDKLDGWDALHLPGVHGVLAWTATDPAVLPKGIAQVLSPQVSEDALGACFAPSVSHPGGVYWIVMVTYR